MAKYKFKRKFDSYEEEFSGGWAFFFTLIGGPIYFLTKEVWNHALITVILAFMTGGISWLIYPFFSKGILFKHYKKKGYELIEARK